MDRRIIKALSGVRTEEVAFMEWKHLHFRKGKGFIILPKTITKKKRRRIFPMLSKLAMPTGFKRAAEFPSRRSSARLTSRS